MVVGKGTSLEGFADTSHRRATVRQALPNTMSDRHGEPLSPCERLHLSSLGAQLYSSEDSLEHSSLCQTSMRFRRCAIM